MWLSEVKPQIFSLFGEVVIIISVGDMLDMMDFRTQEIKRAEVIVKTNSLITARWSQ